MYLISLYFDDNTNKIFQHLMDLVAEKSGNDFMIANHVPPHMTVASIEARNIECLIEAFEKLKGNIYKSEIQFVSPGQLLPYVMYITPVLNKYLQELQMQVFNSFENVDNIRMSKYYQPYSWLPHVTIGKKLSNDEMKIAFEVMQKEFVPFSGEVVSIGLSKVNPIVDVGRFLLA